MKYRKLTRHQYLCISKPVLQALHQLGFEKEFYARETKEHPARHLHVKPIADRPGESVVVMIQVDGELGVYKTNRGVLVTPVVSFTGIHDIRSAIEYVESLG